MLGDIVFLFLLIGIPSGFWWLVTKIEDKKLRAVLWTYEILGPGLFALFYLATKSLPGDWEWGLVLSAISLIALHVAIYKTFKKGAISEGDLDFSIGHLNFWYAFWPVQAGFISQMIDMDEYGYAILLLIFTIPIAIVLAVITGITLEQLKNRLKT